MKKILMILPIAFASSLTVSLPAFATKGAAYVAPACGETSYYSSGFYLGGAIGGNQYVADIESGMDVGYLGINGNPFTPFELGDYAPNETDSRSSSFTGQIQLGYAYINDWFFLAGEISGNGASSSMGLDRSLADVNVSEGNTSILSSDLDIEMNEFEPVVDIKIGFKVTPNSLLYARVGAAFNEIEVKNSVQFEQQDRSSNVLANTVMNMSESNSVVGLRLGVGGEHRFTESLAVTLDYIYTDYGSVDVSGVADAQYTAAACSSGPPCYYENGLVAEDEVNVKRNVVMMGMNYYF